MTTLLAQYFDSSLPSDVMAAVISDWLVELQGYPKWALSNAVRWWLSADNPDRRKRPMPGDIGDRARREMGLIKAGVVVVSRADPALAAALVARVAVSGFDDMKQALGGSK